LRQKSNARDKNRQFEMQAGDDNSRRQDYRNINGRSIHLTVRKQSDGALMVGLVSVLVKQFMQRGRGGHRVQQQHHADQQRREERSARPPGKALLVLHDGAKLASLVPSARFIYCIMGTHSQN